MHSKVPSVLSSTYSIVFSSSFYSIFSSSPLPIFPYSLHERILCVAFLAPAHFSHSLFLLLCPRCFLGHCMNSFHIGSFCFALLCFASNTISSNNSSGRKALSFRLFSLCLHSNSRAAAAETSSVSGTSSRKSREEYSCCIQRYHPSFHQLTV